MKLLTEISDNDVYRTSYELADKTYNFRRATRAILKDVKGKIALLHVTTLGYHKLPGGGVEKGEEIKDGLVREILEETGCTSEIGSDIGLIVEFRYYPEDSNGLIHFSHCFSAKVVGDKGEPEFTEDEIAEGFELKWIEPEKALGLMEQDKPKDYTGHFISKRDKIFLREYCVVK